MSNDPRSLLAIMDRGIALADRVEALSRQGPISLGVLAWQSLPQHTRERVTGDVCPNCGEATSLCECCNHCGFNPCGCSSRFFVDVEGFSVE
jgi:hypothetical protein